VATKLTIRSTSDSAWASTTDLMAGLMIIFLFIAIVYMQNVSNIADDWAKKKEEIYLALYTEFKNDLKDWDARIIKDSLTVRFREPRVLFENGDFHLKSNFERILSDFFPRYVHVLEHNFKDEIAEIRIEGHTSSEWNKNIVGKQAYFKNLVLSHNRSREVAVFSLSLPLTNEEYNWASKSTVAAGMSSSHPIIVDGIENPQESRRVDFRVRTKAEEHLSNIRISVTVNPEE